MDPRGEKVGSNQGVGAYRSDRSKLREVAVLFARLGFTAFGGPAAHIGMMEQEVVHRRRWIDGQHFLDLVAAINFIPGPSSTELAIQLGLIRAGFPGLLVAGVCFITPAVLIILPIAWAYVRFGSNPASGSYPWITAAMTGVSAAVIAIITAAAIRFAQRAVRDRFTGAVAVLAAVALLVLQRFPHLQPDLLVLGLAGIAGTIRYAKPSASTVANVLPLLFGNAQAVISGPPAAKGLLQLSGFFLKIGATLFGSGYVLVSYLQTGLVDQYQWLTPRQLVDAISVGQFTPGPLLTTATFIGYLRGFDLYRNTAGAACGAVVATVSIFLPSFVLVALVGPLLPRIRRNPLARGAFDGMNAAVVALIAVAAVRLGVKVLWPLTAVNVSVVLLGLAALLGWNLNATWLILSGAIAGLLRHAMTHH